MKPYINPINPYTGEISVLAIIENQRNGHDRFPKYMGECLGSGEIVICGKCGVPFRRGNRKAATCDECKNGDIK